MLMRSCNSRRSHITSVSARLPCRVDQLDVAFDGGRRQALVRPPELQHTSNLVEEAWLAPCQQVVIGTRRMFDVRLGKPAK